MLTPSSQRKSRARLSILFLTLCWQPQHPQGHPRPRHGCRTNYHAHLPHGRQNYTTAVLQRRSDYHCACIQCSQTGQCSLGTTQSGTVVEVGVHQEVSIHKDYDVRPVLRLATMAAQLISLASGTRVRPLRPRPRYCASGPQPRQASATPWLLCMLFYPRLSWLDPLPSSCPIDFDRTHLPRNRLVLIDSLSPQQTLRRGSRSRLDSSLW